MADEAWQSLVASVLSNLEPPLADASRICDRLRADGTLHLLYSAWKCGGDPTQIGRMIRRAAERVR